MISDIKKLLEATNAHPFLFVGSGFTHRYLKTVDWKGLVSHFAKQAKPDEKFAYELYRNEVSTSGDSSSEDLPAIASLVETDYVRRFLSHADFQELREKYTADIEKGVSSLKIGVADLLSDLESQFPSAHHPEEIAAIGHARKNVAGIITTNFDEFLEHLFPEHIRYVGQNQLLFNESYGVGEIYKIHGCASEPDSLVLTSNDYKSYSKRNAYLSAKLMTIFLEHPIIFIGYSLQDTNIRMIFNDIAQCLTEEQLSTLSSRLIFVQRAKEGRPKGIRTIRESLDSGVIESTGVVLNDFSDLYKAIAALRSSYSPKILRKLKKDIYQMVKSSAPKERISVMDIDETTDMDQVQYVMGVGISNVLAGQGYSGLDVVELIEDLICNGEEELDAAQIVQTVLPKRGKQCSFNLPVFKYTSQVGASTISKVVTDYTQKVDIEGIDFWITKSMRQSQNGKQASVSIEHL